MINIVTSMVRLLKAPSLRNKLPALLHRGFVLRDDDPIRVLPSGQHTRVAQILVGDRAAESACAGQSVTLALTDEIDVSRGHVLVAASSPPQIAEQFEATAIWMHDEPMLPGRSYLFKIGTRTVSGMVARKRT